MFSTVKVGKPAAVFCGMALALTICACETTTPAPITLTKTEVDVRVPLTMSAIQRFSGNQGNMQEDLKRFQLHLFGRITLESMNTETSVVTDSYGPRFENVHIREVLTINDQTEGQVIGLEATNQELILLVSFDDTNNALRFANTANNPEGFFYLKDTTRSGFGPRPDDGSIEYGDRLFRVRYTERPYLLIRLSQKDIDRIYDRTLWGRRVQ
ncbi:MAG: hypothetical protein FWD94_08585 [Treponema sp.]|jgi:hypothetical protein|nr:hypothetical protein [Treponema sp.]